MTTSGYSPTTKSISFIKLLFIMLVLPVFAAIFAAWIFPAEQQPNPAGEPAPVMLTMNEIYR